MAAPKKGDIFSDTAWYKRHEEKTGKEDEPAELVADSPHDVAIANQEIGLGQHPQRQMKDAKAKAEGKHLQWFIHRDKKQRNAIPGQTSRQKVPPR